MTYDNVCRAVFLKRLDRFSALVDRDGSRETVHVKNTGRLGELFVPGAEVWLSRAASPGRKTAYDLVTVRKADGALYNVDILKKTSKTLLMKIYIGHTPPAKN